jgi:hypothetical protein
MPMHPPTPCVNGHTPAYRARLASHHAYGPGVLSIVRGLGDLPEEEKKKKQKKQQKKQKRKKQRSNHSQDCVQVLPSRMRARGSRLVKVVSKRDEVDVVLV